MDADNVLTDREWVAEQVRRNNAARDAMFNAQAEKQQEARARYEANRFATTEKDREQLKQFESASANFIAEKMARGDYSFGNQLREHRKATADAKAKAEAKAQYAAEHPELRDTRSSAQKLADIEKERGFEDDDTDDTDDE
jgi:hypothetical protein